MTDFSSGSPPGFWRMFWSQGALLPLSLSVLLVIMSIFVGRDMRIALSLLTHGQTVQGDVIDRETRLEVVDGMSRRVHYLTIEYPVISETARETRQVPLEVFEAAPPGVQRSVRFLESNPRIVEFSVGTFWRNARGGLWLPVAIGLMAIGLMWHRGRAVLPALNAQRFGTEEQAHVMGVASHGRKHVLVWRDARGEVGESLPSSRDRYERYPPGKVITVMRYSGGRAWWSGDVGLRPRIGVKRTA